MTELQFPKSNFRFCMGWCAFCLHQLKKVVMPFLSAVVFRHTRCSTFQVFTSIVTRKTVRMPWPLVKLVKSWMLLFDVVERNQVHHRFWRIQRTRLVEQRSRKTLGAKLIDRSYIYICILYSCTIYFLYVYIFHVFIHVVYTFTICTAFYIVFIYIYVWYEYTSHPGHLGLSHPHAFPEGTPATAHSWSPPCLGDTWEVSKDGTNKRTMIPWRIYIEKWWNELVFV